MARKKPKDKAAGFTMVNVAYEDGTMTSNRRVANELLDQSFGDGLQDLARTAIEDQDNEIAQRSGERRARIKSSLGPDVGFGVMTGRTAALSGRSETGGEADENFDKTDIVLFEVPLADSADKNSSET